MQWPHAQHVIDLPAILGGDKAPDKQPTGDHTGDQRAYRVHQVGTGADRHQPGQRAVMQEAWVVTADHQRSNSAADHRHQRVDRHQATDALRVCALITLKPNQPTMRIQEPSARNGMLDGAKATSVLPDNVRYAGPAATPPPAPASRPWRAPRQNRRSHESWRQRWPATRLAGRNCHSRPCLRKTGR